MKTLKRGFLVTILLFSMIFGISGCGSDNQDSIYSFEQEPKDIDPWTYLKETSIYMNGPIQNFASSASGLGITIGVIGIVFSIFIMVIRLFFSSSAKTKSEVKDQIMMKSCIAIMIFNIPLWLGIFKMLGELLI